MIDNAHNLLEELASSCFRQSPVVHDVIEQLSSSIFHDHNDMRRGIYHLVPG